MSNIDKKLLEGTIDNSKLEVDGYVTADEVKSYNPRYSHWKELLSRYNLSKGEVLHIAGSVYHDIVPAATMGFRTVWVNRYDRPVPSNVNPTYVVSNL